MAAKKKARSMGAMTPTRNFQLAKGRAANAKKPVAGPPAPQTYLYHIEEISVTWTTADMQSKLDELGLQGWELLWVGAQGDTSNTIRAFFIMPGA